MRRAVNSRQYSFMDGTDAGRYKWQDAFEELAGALRERTAQQRGQDTREDTQEDTRQGKQDNRQSSRQSDAQESIQNDAQSNRQNNRQNNRQEVTQQDKDEDRERRYSVRVARDEKAPILVMMPPGYGKTRTILIQARTALAAGVIPIIVVAEPYRAMVFQVVREIWPDMARAIAEAVVERREERYGAVEDREAVVREIESRLPEPVTMAGAVDTRRIQSYLTVGTYENIAMMLRDGKARVGMLTRVDDAAEMLRVRRTVEWTTGAPIDMGRGVVVSGYARELLDTVFVDEAHNIYKERGVEIDAILRQAQNYRRVLLSGTMPDGIVARIEAAYGETTRISMREDGSPYGLQWIVERAPERGERRDTGDTGERAERAERGERGEKGERGELADRKRLYARTILEAQEGRGVSLLFATSRAEAEAIAVAAYNIGRLIGGQRGGDRDRDTRKTEEIEDTGDMADGRDSRETDEADEVGVREETEVREESIDDVWRREQPALTQNGNLVAQEALDIFAAALTILEERGQDAGVETRRGRPVNWSRPTMDDLREGRIYVDHADSNSKAVRALLDRQQDRVAIVAATTTLAEGVNVRNAVRVAIPVSRMWDWAKYRQMQGRVGRFAEGQVLTTVTRERFEEMTNPGTIEVPVMTPQRTLQAAWAERRRVPGIAGKVIEVQVGGYWRSAPVEMVRDLAHRIGVAGRAVNTERQEAIDRATGGRPLTAEAQETANALEFAMAAERIADAAEATRAAGNEARVAAYSALERIERVVVERDRRTNERGAIPIADWFPEAAGDTRGVDAIVVAAAAAMADPRAKRGEMLPWTLRSAIGNRMDKAQFLLMMANGKLAGSAWIGMVAGVQQVGAMRDNPVAAKGAIDWSVAGTLADDWTVGYLPVQLEEVLALRFDDILEGAMDGEMGELDTVAAGRSDVDTRTVRGKAVRMARIYAHFTHWVVSVILGYSRKRYYKFSPGFFSQALADFLNRNKYTITPELARMAIGAARLAIFAQDLMRTYTEPPRNEAVVLSPLMARISQGDAEGAAALAHEYTKALGVSLRQVERSPLLKGEEQRRRIARFLEEVR